MSDSRLQQIIACLDDARTTAADLLEDPPADAEWVLTRVRNLMNMCIEDVQKLADERCQTRSFGGWRCELRRDHHRGHQNGAYTWTDADTKAAIKRYGSRFD